MIRQSWHPWPGWSKFFGWQTPHHHAAPTGSAVSGMGASTSRLRSGQLGAQTLYFFVLLDPHDLCSGQLAAKGIDLIAEQIQRRGDVGTRRPVARACCLAD